MSLRFNINRCTKLLAAAFVVATATAGTPATVANAQAAPLPMAGEVTIIAPAGMTGIRLAVPDVGKTVRMYNELTTVEELYSGDYGHVEFALSTSQLNHCLTEAEFCDYSFITVAPDMQEPDALDETNGLARPHDSCVEDGEDGARLPCRIRSDTFDIYIATDAPLTFTIRFPALDGSVTHHVNGKIDGLYEAYPVTDCPTDDCDRLSIGSSVQNFGTPDRNAFVRGYAYARADYARITTGVRSAVLSSIGAEACLYPSYLVPSGSTDPDDHPLGCDFTPLVNDQGDVEWDPDSRRTYLDPTAQSVSHRPHWPFLDGSDAYFGFNVRNQHYTPEYEGAHGAWVVWLEQGIYAP